MQVSLGEDENNLMMALSQYLADNQAVLRRYFEESDKDKNGVNEGG
jgi:hypothetical protein